MSIRSLDHTANRSGVIARRASVVALAAAVVIAPVFAAAPAIAEPVPAFPITSITFDDTELVYGEETQGYFNGARGLTQLDDVLVCEFEYVNGEPHKFNGATATTSASAPLQNWGFLTSNGYREGDVYTIAYAAPLANDDQTEFSCVAPALGTPGLVQASLTLAPTPAAPVLPASAAPLTLKQGVAFDQIVAITLDAGFDFSEKGGWVAAGPRNSGEFENGNIYPLDGVEFEFLNENTPGVTPTLRAYGTPKYSGTLQSGFEISDLTSVGSGSIVFEIAPANGISSPIQIEAVAGQAVTGAKVNVIVSGLKEGAAWDVTVRSTPIIVGSGTIAFGGQLAQTVAIPAGLAAGSHSITVTSTRADGTPFSSVLYFTVSASGTLVSVSATAPTLPDTGADVYVPSLFAGGLLVAGLAFAGASVYRRRKSN